MVNQTVSPSTSSLTPQPKSPDIPQSSKNESKKIIIILIFLLLTVTTIAGYFVYQNYQLQGKIEHLQLSVTPSPAISLPESPEIQTPTESVSFSGRPSIPGANVLISVVDENYQTINEGTLEISVELEGDLSYYNKSYNQKLSSLSDGLLGIHPPPSSYPSKILIRVVAPSGKKSDTLVIKNKEYWEAVEKTSLDYVGTHQFDLSQPDKVTYLIYSPLSKGRSSCEHSGGRWVETGPVLADGQQSIKYCYYPPADEGKKCYEDSECIIDCVSTSNTDEEGYILGKCGEYDVYSCTPTIPKKTKDIKSLKRDLCV